MAKASLLPASNEQFLNLIAERFKALGEPSRLKLLMCLANKERTVSELVEASGLSQANVSRHLQTLMKAGILARRKDKLNVYYHICDTCIPELCDLMCGSLKKQLQTQVKAFA